MRSTRPTFREQLQNAGGFLWKSALDLVVVGGDTSNRLIPDSFSKGGGQSIRGEQQGGWSGAVWW